MKMITDRDDDYLVCKHYYNNIDKVSSEYPGFITFEHNNNHYFAWVNDGKVILRSEAYPSEEKNIRGIKAILKNKDLVQRYSIDSQHGVHFLQLWGGGDHQKHSGNFESHNEIGRSCPAKTIEELHNLLLFMGKDFADKVVPLGDKSKGAATTAVIGTAATAASAIAATSKSTAASKTTTNTKAAAVASGAAATKAAGTSGNDSSGGFKWWWLLPLLLIPLFFMWKGCGNDKIAPVEKIETSKTSTEVENEASTAAEAKEKEAAALQAKADTDAADAAAKLEAEKIAAEEKARKTQVASGSDSGNVTYGNKTSGY